MNEASPELPNPVLYFINYLVAPSQKDKKLKFPILGRNKQSVMGDNKKSTVNNIRVISGANNIGHTIASFQSNIKKDWCACVDASIPAFSMSNGIKQGYIAAKERGVRIRYITEINLKNLKICEQLMEYVELRHIPGVRGSFAVSEFEFIAGIRGNEMAPLTKLVYCDVGEMVAHQRDAFETFWQNATPALSRIKELKI